jgi:hypothetical protein
MNSAPLVSLTDGQNKSFHLVLLQVCGRFCI